MRDTINKYFKVLIVFAIGFVAIYKIANSSRVKAIAATSEVVIESKGAQIRTVNDGKQGIRIVNTVVSQPINLAEIHYGLLLCNFTKTSTATSIDDWVYENKGNDGINAIEVETLGTFVYENSYAITVYGFNEEQYNIDLRYRPYARYKIVGDENEYISYGNVTVGDITNNTQCGDRSIAEVALNLYAKDSASRENDFISNIASYVKNNYDSLCTANEIKDGYIEYSDAPTSYKFRIEVPELLYENGFKFDSYYLYPTIENEGSKVYQSDIFGNILVKIPKASTNLRYSILPDGTYQVTGLVDEEYSPDFLVIPEDYYEIPITSVALPCSSRSKTVILPNSITSINEGSFFNFSNLKSITIPSSVSNIGPYAFADCSELQEVIFEDDSQLVIFNDGLFSNCISLKSIIIPKSIKDIDQYAFQCCYSLTKVEFEEDSRLETIGQEAFYCTNIFKITLPSRLVYIGDNAFGECHNLIEIYNKSRILSIEIGSLDNGLIGEYARNIYSEENGSKLFTTEDGFTLYTDGDEVILVSYEGKTGNVVIPSNVTRISRYAFTGVDMINNQPFVSVTIPDSIKRIDDYAFDDCSDLMTVNFSSNSQLEYLGIGAFKYCNNLININLGVNSKLEAILDSTFSVCDSLRTITIPDSVTSIEIDAFYECSQLGYAKINEESNLTTIGERAFSSAGLVSFTIPSGVTSIGLDAFGNCYYLKEVINYSAMLMDNPEYGSLCDAQNICTSSDSAKLLITENGLLIYSDGEDRTVIDYIGTLNDIVIPNFVTAIGESAFYENKHISRVTFEEGSQLTTISMDAFSFSSIVSIQLPNSLTTIEDEAFDGCYNIVEIFNESSLEIELRSYSNGGIAENAKYVYTVEGEGRLSKTEDDFILYSEGEEITLVSYVGNSANISIPSGITNIGNNCILNNWTVKKVIIPNTVTQISDEAFLQCYTLEKVVFEPNSQLQSIDSCAFAHCQSLKSISIGQNVTYIGDSAFQGCYSLRTVDFAPNSNLEYIGSYAFNGCSELQTITIPSKVRLIGTHAFESCYFDSVFFENQDGWFLASNADATSGIDIIISVEDLIMNVAMIKDNISYFWICDIS